MKNHEILEKNVGLLAIFMVIAVSIGGLTGTLSLNPTQRIERQLQWAEFRNGQVQPLGTSSF